MELTMPEIDLDQIREIVSDLDEMDREVVKIQRRIRLARQQIQIAIGDRKPKVQQLKDWTSADGKRFDLSKYRE